MICQHLQWSYIYTVYNLEKFKSWKYIVNQSIKIKHQWKTTFMLSTHNRKLRKSLFAS